MIEWLEKQMLSNQDVPTAEVIFRIAGSMLLGFIVAAIFSFTRPRHDTAGTKGILATIVLLSILLAMVVMAVGNSAARAFTLAGVLAIVRFRTVVEDTRDAAFVICAVVVGMSAGAGYFSVAMVGLPFVALAAYLTQNHQVRKITPTSQLTIKFDAKEPLQQPIDALLQRYSEHYMVRKHGTCKKGNAFEVTYRIRLKSGMNSFDLVRDLKTLNGMHSVDWKAT
jgi:uncharacterized membrane protein YhiD involved in acid resistance